MEVSINGQNYKVIVEKKNNKNTYIRVKKDLTILVTTNYFVSKKEIKNLLDRNKDYIHKMIEKRIKEYEKEQSFYYLGKKYDIIIVPTMLGIDITETKIFVSSYDYLDKWYKKQVKDIFSNKLDNIYNLFKEAIPYPKLKIRKMKTRWGVCNRKNISITLNADLIKVDESKIDYVIIHELSHFIHFNHSKDFWSLVSIYCPNYKKIRRSMKE